MGEVINANESDWEKCPYCNHNEIVAEQPEMDGRHAWVTVWCRRCLNSWVEVYEATSREAGPDEEFPEDGEFFVPVQFGDEVRWIRP